MKSVKRVIVFFLLLATSISFGWAADYPSKPVEMVVHTAAGGASDIIARMIIDVISREKLCPQPITVVNKVGGGGAVAVNYVAERKDPHILNFISTTNYLGSFMKAQIHATPQDFVPIAMFYEDLNVYAVGSTTPYKDLKDLIADAKKEPKKVIFGFGAVGGSGHILGFMLAKAAGVEFNYLPHKSGSEAIISALAGRISLISENPSELMSQVSAGKLRMVGLPTPERHPALPDVPTLKELGYDVVFGTARGIVAFKGIPDEAVSYWAAIFKKVSENARFKSFIKENMAREEFLAEAKFGAYLDRHHKLMEPIVAQMGLKK